MRGKNVMENGKEWLKYRSPNIIAICPPEWQSTAMSMLLPIKA